VIVSSRARGRDQGDLGGLPARHTLTFLKTFNSLCISYAIAVTSYTVISPV
jgi:hypothetical protein